MTRASKRKHWSHVLSRLNACPPAIRWARRQPSLRRAYKVCKRGDWMMWAVTQDLEDDPRAPSRRKLALCIADIVSLALPRAGDQKVIMQVALDALNEWGNGNGTMEELRAIARASKKVSEIFLSASWRASGTAEGAALYACGCALSAASCAASSTICNGRKAADIAQAITLHSMDSAEHAAIAQNMSRKNAMNAELFAQANIIRKYYPHPPNLAIRSARRKTATSQR